MGGRLKRKLGRVLAHPSPNPFGVSLRETRGVAPCTPRRWASFATPSPEVLRFRVFDVHATIEGMQNEPLRIALLGAGHISAKMGTTLAFLRGERGIEPYAVASRDLARAEALRAEKGFAKAFGSYGEMLADPAVDVVYVATPNSFHYEHVKACLEAGKHVLCEKPFTLRTAEAEELFALAKERNRFLMEAVWPRFQPIVPLVREALSSGEIGDPRFLQATFALSIATKQRLREPSLGGGALLDLGVYALHFADLYFGLEGAEIVSVGTRAPEGCDDQSTLILTWPDGRMAALTTSMTAALGAYARIGGTKGNLEFPALTLCQSFVRHILPNGGDRTVECPFGCNGYEYEIRAMARAIREGRLECEEAPWSATLRTTRIMEDLRRRWGCATV